MERKYIHFIAGTSSFFFWVDSNLFEKVLVSIQSLILVDKPYFNEPGYEDTMNSPEGEQASDAYNQEIRAATGA